MIATFVVGGESSFVQSKITQQLLRHNMSVVGHWDWKRKRVVPIPIDAEAVFVITDMCSHRSSDKTITEAQKRKLPVIYGQRKYAENSLRLTTAGFPAIPVETTPENVMPIVPAGMRFAVYKLAIAQDMTRDHHAVHERAEELCLALEDGPFDLGVPRRGDVSRSRGALGVAWSPGRPRADGTRAITVDVVQFETECANLGIVPHYPEGVSQIPPAFDKIEVVAVPEPEPEPEPAPAPEVRVPEPNGVGKVMLPEGWSQELADIIGMLRDEMQQCDMKSLSVTPDGTTFQRVVIVEGTYDG